MYKNKKFKISIWIMFVIYMISLSYLLLCKFYNFTVLGIFFSEWNVDAVLEGIKNINLVPIQHTFNDMFNNSSPDTHYYRRIFVYNIIAFIPYGVMLPILFSKINSIKKVILVGAITSLSYEVIQIFTTLGKFDIDDIILNTTGTFIGGVIFYIVTYTIHRFLLEKKLSN